MTKYYSARTTTIEWTDHSWNPMVGCTRASAGCHHCYAEKMAHRLGNMGQQAYTGTTKDWRWTGIINRNTDEVVRKPTLITKPSKIFIASMSDFWHPNAADALRVEAFAIMDQTPQHRYQVLTKRPEAILPTLARMGRVLPRGAWVGTSVEDHRVVSRIDALRQMPATIRFLSIEPLIGPVGVLDLRGIAWVIVGGESGPHARPCHPDWVRGIRDQCLAAGAAFFFKQWGTAANNPLAADYARSRQDGESLVGYISRVDRSHGGSLLDGHRHKDFPADPTWS